MSGLAGARVLVTRPEGEDGELARLLEDAGAVPIPLPVMSLRPLLGPEQLEELRAAVRAGRFHLIAFTSAHAVRLLALAPPADLRLELFAIGPGTAAAARELGWSPRPLPSQFVAESLAAAMLAFGVRGRRVLLPRAAGARDALPRALEEAGAIVTEVPLYRAEPALGSGPRLRQLLQAGRLDWVTFTSSSTVSSFSELAGRALPQRCRVACIGPVTAASARQLAIEPDVVARVHSLAGLVAAMAAAPVPDNIR